MIPDYLKIENFLSHDHSEIDFKKFDLALILGSYEGETDQSNGSGKTAILAAILWALFGKSRHKKKDGVVKWDRRSCKVEFSFWIGEDLYKITRVRDKIVAESDVVFEKWDGTQFSSVGCDTNSATEDKIVDTINVNYEVFINSIYFKQNDISMFATSTPGKRKDVLKSLLKMEKWDQYQKKAKDRAKILSTKIDEKSNLVTPLPALELALTQNKKSVADIEGLLSANSNDYDINSIMLTDLRSKYSLLYSDVGHDAEERLVKLNKELSNLVLRKNKLDKTIQENNKYIESATTQLSAAKQKTILLKEKIKAKKDVDLAFLRSKFIDGKSKESILSNKISELKKSVSFSGECDLCGRPVSEEEAKKIKEERSEKLETLQNKHSELKEKVLKVSKLLKEKELIVEEANKAEVEVSKIEAKISKTQSEVDNKILENERFVVELDNANNTNLQSEIDTLNEKLNKANKKELKERINSLETLLTSLKSKGNELSRDYGSLLTKQTETIETINKQKEMQAQIERLKSELIIYDKLKNYFGKDGIQSIIIENVIGELENYTNETLEKICNEPTSISIKTQRQNENGSWAETVEILTKIGPRTDDFESLCGGEQFRISLAIRLALSQILSSRMGSNIKFLMLDEVSSSLDNKGLRMFMDTIKSLSNEMKVLVITHDDRLKDMFDYVIMVDKGPNGSKVTAA